MAGTDREEVDTKVTSPGNIAEEEAERLQKLEDQETCCEFVPSGYERETKQ